mgnify:CR=1 FL=1
MANASQNQEDTIADENIEEVVDTQETLEDDSRQVVAEDIDAVSYTHLTLPTITE